MNAPVSQAPRQFDVRASTRRERLRDTAQELARAGGAAAATGARRVVQQVRERPVTAGLIALGALGGGALLMNTALRRLAIANAPLLWRAGKHTLERVRQEATPGAPPSSAV